MAAERNKNISNTFISMSKRLYGFIKQRVGNIEDAEDILQEVFYQFAGNNNKHIRKVKPASNLHPYIKAWNVDLHDCDKVLRVVSDNNHTADIKQILFAAGYFCEEIN